MILLDTCVLIFDALSPKRLSARARAALKEGEADGALACADISLWELAMLTAKGRLDPGTETEEFCRLAVTARGVQVLPVTPAIAAVSAALELLHGDPADRLIGATARTHEAVLVTCDERLLATPQITTLW